MFIHLFIKIETEPPPKKKHLGPSDYTWEQSTGKNCPRHISRGKSRLICSLSLMKPTCKLSSTCYFGWWFNYEIPQLL